MKPKELAKRIEAGERFELAEQQPSDSAMLDWLEQHKESPMPLRDNQWGLEGTGIMEPTLRQAIAAAMQESDDAEM